MRVTRRTMLSMSDTQQQSPAVPDWTLGWRLRRALEFAGIKAGDMATELDVARSTVTRWMHGDGAPPRDVYLRYWAERCGVPLEWLKGDDSATGGEHARNRRVSDRHVDAPQQPRTPKGAGKPAFWTPSFGESGHDLVAA